MENRLVVSYMTLRSAIGIAGMVLAIVVALGGLLAGLPLQDSISAYYWTTSQDILVGTLAIAGALLLTYKGYDKTDNWIATLMGVSAIGIALFPTLNGYHGEMSDSVGFFQLSGYVTNVLHYVFAASLFLLLGYMSYFQFTKTNERKNVSVQKEQRNVIFRACGIVIVAAFALLVLLKAIAPQFSEDFNTVFWLEFVMLVAFGVSWLTKGQLILKDQE